MILTSCKAFGVKNKNKARGYVGTESPKKKAEIDRTEKSITLRWKYNEKNVTRFLIYRAVNDEPLSLYKSVAENSFIMKDLNLKMNSRYNYIVKVVFKDGTSAEFSREVKLSF